MRSKYQDSQWARSVCLCLTLSFLGGCSKPHTIRYDHDAETKGETTKENGDSEQLGKYESTHGESIISENQEYGSSTVMSDGHDVMKDASIDSSNEFQGRDETFDAESSMDQSCSENGALRCVSAASAAREICQNGVWKSTNDCKDGEVCVTLEMDQSATCIDSTMVCKDDDDCSTEDSCMKSYCSENNCKTRPDADAVGKSCGKDNQGVCDSYGSCVGCRDDDNCVPPKSICTTTNVCVACENNNDCDSGICRVRENVADNECVECLEREHCDPQNPTSWKCEQNQCVYLPECGNGIHDSDEQCDDGTPVEATSPYDWDGCGLKCQFNRVWGCEDSADGYRIIYEETQGWVWTIPHPKEAGLATCAIPCGPKHDIQSQVYGTCENGTPIPGTDPVVYTECINGMCVIPCDANGDCPIGYECENPLVLDVTHYLRTGGANGGEKEYTNAFSMCLAKDFYEK